jgi:DNA repair protein RadC
LRLLTAASPVSGPVASYDRSGRRKERRPRVSSRDTQASATSDDRPREKLERLGPSALGDNELLALVIGHGMPDRSAFTLANDVLSLTGGVQGLARVHRHQLLAVPGVGPAHAARIQGAIELGRRTLVPARQSRPQFLTPRDAALYLLPLYGAHAVERFGVLLLDTKYRLLATRIVSVGSLDASVASPREVFREAVAAGAAVLVAFHNHPSGDPAPSQDDIAVTHRLQQAGAIVGVELADHVILADARYCSLREMRLL